MHNLVDNPWIIGTSGMQKQISLEINKLLHLVVVMLVDTQYIDEAG